MDRDSPLTLGALSDSPYAAELRRGTQHLRFAPPLEAEYTRSRLLQSRMLIRMACLLSGMLTILRGGEQILENSWDRVPLMDFGLIIGGSLLLAWLAWSASFERLYLPWANVIIPLKNAIASIRVAEAAAHGHPEMLMVMPLVILGPFFFLGLRFRNALICNAVAIICFTGATIISGLSLPVILRVIVLLLLGTAVCTVAALHVERQSRTAFLESRLIADLAQHDGLTGTKNRRVFDEYLPRLWQQAREDRRALAILLIDVDHFKAYNDRYGHQAGDQTLRRVAQTAQRFVRRPLDVLTRYGGEEFAALLYDVDGDQARETAERICRAVGALGIEHRDSRTAANVTISVGVAVIEPTLERNPRGALQLADQALYEAKIKGRNRVELMDEAQHRMLVTGVFPSTSAV